MNRKRLRVNIDAPISGEVNVKNSQDTQIGGTGNSSKNRGPNFPAIVAVILGIVAVTAVLVYLLIRGMSW